MGWTGATKAYVPGPHYEHARRINSVLKAWGPTLMDLNSTGVYRVGVNATASTVLRGCAVSDLHNQHQPNNFLVGQFTRRSDGATVVLLNNWEYSFTAWPTVTFAVASVAASVREVDPGSGAEVPVLDDSPRTPGLQLRVGAGNGRLFVVAPGSVL